MHLCECGTPANWLLTVVDNMARESLRAFATCDLHLVSNAHKFDHDMRDDFDPKTVHLRIRKLNPA